MVHEVLLNAPLEESAADPVRVLFFAGAMVKPVELLNDLPWDNVCDARPSERIVDCEMPPIELDGEQSEPRFALFEKIGARIVERNMPGADLPERLLRKNAPGLRAGIRERYDLVRPDSLPSSVPDEYDESFRAFPARTPKPLSEVSQRVEFGFAARMAASVNEGNLSLLFGTDLALQSPALPRVTMCHVRRNF